MSASAAARVATAERLAAGVPGTNARCVRRRASNTPSSAATHNKKQTPETRSTLTKLLRFSPPAPAGPARAPAEDDTLG